MKNTRSEKKNKRPAGRAKKLPVVLLCALLAVMIAAGAVFNDEIGFFAAEKAAEAGRWSAALNLLKGCDGEKAAGLEKYASLRAEIMNDYPALAESFDEEKLERWCETAKELSASGSLDGDLDGEANGLYVKLRTVVSANANYSNLHLAVLDFMNIFNEYNRLHLQVNGENESFTVESVTRRLDTWQTELDAIMRYACCLPEYEGVYLLSYLIKEGQSELAELRRDMQKITDGGYAPDDIVRYSDNAGRTFPSVKNKDGVSFNLAEREKYEQQLQLELRKHLVTTQLTEYYYS